MEFGLNNVVTKMFLVLTVIGAVSGCILVGVLHVADPLIQANREKELKEAIFVVLPEAKGYKILEKGIDKTKVIVYQGLDADGRPVGLAFIADGGGVQGNIRIMVGLSVDYLKIQRIKGP